MELIEQQKRQIESCSSPWDKPIPACEIYHTGYVLYVCGCKETSKYTKDWGKPFLGTTRLPELSKSLDGSLDPNLSCRYCKDTSHEKKNCRQLQRKLAHDHLATQGIVAQEQ